jgi:hypothetical protein
VKQITVPMMQSTVAHIALAMNEPCMFWSEPGCGKTEGIYQVCLEEDVDLVDIRLGQYDSVDLRGFPDIDRETNTTVWHPPSTLPFVGNPRFQPERRKLIFLDEINGAVPQTQAIGYQLVQEGRIGEQILQPNTFIVAAGNREHDRGATNRMVLPLANRFTHYEVRPDADAWCWWAQLNGQPNELIAFMQFMPGRISNFDPQKPDKAFATGRTWAKAGRYFLNQGLSLDLKEASIHGAVGAGPASDFLGFVDVIKDVPNMASIIRSPTRVGVPDRPELLYAIATGISGTMDEKNVAKFQKYLDRMPPDFRIVAWQLALRRDKKLNPPTGKLMHTPTFETFAEEFNEIFATIG